VLDNLSTHTTPGVETWLEKHPDVHFHFTPFGIITRQSIRCGMFSLVKVLVKQIRDYIAHWSTTPEPFVWTATADEILVKVRLAETNVKKLVDNDAK
jgi:hypothetical protein